MKRIFGFLILFLSCVYVLTPLASADTLEDAKISDLFIDFIDEVYEDLDGLSALDSNGLDITKEFINNTSRYYTVKDYKSIQDIIKDQDLSISHKISTDITNLQNEELGINAVSGVRTESASQQFYHIATDKKGKFTKEWIVTLNGSFSYNTSTFKVTSVTGPRITLTTANFGALFAPALEGILTSNSYSGFAAKFTANYTMRATLGVSFGDLPINFNYDFGTHTDTFTAYPSVLIP